MTLDEAQDEIVKEFAFFDDWMDKYTYLIACGAALPAFAPEHRRDDYLVKGCASKVWLRLARDNGRFFMECDSDSMIVKGMLALYRRLLNGRAVNEVSEADLYFLSAAGIAENMPQSRMNGMNEVAAKIKIFTANPGSN